MSRHGSLALLLAAGLAALSLGIAWGEETDLEELGRRLAEAPTDPATERVLDEIASLVGKDPRLPDAAALGDWLGRLDGPKGQGPRVRLRRGWAYLAGGRPASAREVLEGLATTTGEARAVALAYLGEASRQEGDLARAFELLAAAAVAGYQEPFLAESATKAAFQLRVAAPSRDAEGLPAYVPAVEGFLAVHPHAPLEAAVARWLLDDHEAYAVPGTERTTLWARRAGVHALAALDAQAPGADARLAFDAASALAPEDEASGGRTPRFELLVHAWRLGNRPESDGHEIPAALVLLAEAAAREGRYELAWRLARQRLALSDSPAARRVLDALPPDVGD